MVYKVFLFIKSGTIGSMEKMQNSELKKKLTKEEILEIPVPERFQVLAEQQKQDFIEYYGLPAQELVELLEKDSGGKYLIESVVRYGMHLPDLEIISKEELEKRVKELLVKSGNILKRINELQNVLTEYNLDENKKEEVEYYVNNLHSRAIHILKSRFQIAQQQNEGTVRYLQQTESIQKDLEISDQELFLNLYWFKYAREKVPPPTIEQLIDHSIERKKSNELTQEEQNIIISIYQENWAHESPEFQKHLITTVSESFLQKDSEFILIKNHKEVVGFIRFQNYGNYEYASKY